MKKHVLYFLNLLLIAFLCLPCVEVSAQSLSDIWEQILNNPQDNKQDYQQKLNMLKYVETVLKEKMK